MSHRLPSSRARFEELKREDDSNYSVNGRRSADEKKHRDRSARSLVREFLRMLPGHRRSIALALTTLGIATLLALIPPVATKFVVDCVIGEEPLPKSVPDWVPRNSWRLLATITMGVLAISLVKSALHIWGRWHATRVTKLLQMSVRKRVFSHVLRLPLHRVQEMKSGGAASVLRQDAGSVGELVFGMLYNPFRAAIQLIGSLVILSLVDWRLLIGALVIIPAVFVTHRTWINRIRPQHRRVRAQREEVDALATESFGGMRVVRAFSRQRSETNRILRGNHVMGRQELYAWWWTRTVEIVWEVLMPLASTGLLLYGGWRVLENELTLGELMMFLVYLLMLLGPLAVLAQSAAQFQNSLSGLDRVLDLLEEPREMLGDGELKRVDAVYEAGRLTFVDVNFRYPAGGQNAVSEISLDVQPGETIALVGPSGAGKTTVCNLVARFYDPSDGQILLDGHDLKELDVESYRTLIGIVEQDVFLFDGSVGANIGYGNRHATQEEIEKAANAANAHEFIVQLPQGYDSIIGERGVKLSGGQRQRLAIARAILADPRILILDEATSSLDTESERLIQTSLSRLMEQRTSFVIAHRLSTIAHADRIIVMEGGRIVQIGTHSELMASEGKYRDMVALQTSPPNVA